MPDELPIEPIPEPTPEPIVDNPIKRAEVKTNVDTLIQELSPLIRQEDITEIRCKSDTCSLDEILDYLSSNIPEVKDYLNSIPVDASDEEKVSIIKKGLKKRAESMVPDYEMPPPFLGNDVEEARSKQEDAGTRYKAQYGKVPFVSPVYRGRSAIDNPYYESTSKALSRTRSNPTGRDISTRISSQ
jgi:hypothetical protein